MGPELRRSHVVQGRRRWHGRASLLGVILSMALIGTAVLTVPSAEASPRPTLKQVQQKVETLQRQAEQASEQYNETKVQLTSINVRLAALKVQQTQQHLEVSQAQQQVGRLAAETYRRGQLSTLDLVLGDDADAALAQAGYLPSLADRQVGAMNRLKQGEQQLAATQAQILTRQRSAKQAETKLKNAKTTVNRKLAEANAQLHSLKASQRRTVLRNETSFEGGDVPGGAGTAFCDSKADDAPTAAGRTAIRYACAHLGDSYVWAASGPSHFDCSGLTMRAFAAAGVTLPHSSRLQANYGTRVSTGSLQAGDLIFFYSPISHVAIYLGGGLMVHAPHTGDVVRVASVYRTPTAAVRF